MIFLKIPSANSVENTHLKQSTKDFREEGVDSSVIQWSGAMYVTNAADPTSQTSLIVMHVQQCIVPTTKLDISLQQEP